MSDHERAALPRSAALLAFRGIDETDVGRTP
jgi:hypothetical protein